MDRPRPAARIGNRPGLPALAYRIGDYAGFRHAMLDRLADANGATALQALTTRQDDDFGIALVDLWAYVADILTFYQERTANEAYLGTARQPDSLRRLAALLDYRPAPGTAAAVHLAFTVAAPTPAVAEVVLPAGLRVQSVPGGTGQPQKFETLEGCRAHHAWNELHPLTHHAQRWDEATGTIELASAVRPPAPGDALLLAGIGHDADPDAGYWDFRRVRAVAGTALELDDDLSGAQPDAHGLPAGAYTLRGRAALFGANAPSLAALPELTRHQLAGNDVKIHTTTTETTTDAVRTISTTTDLLAANGGPPPPLPADWNFAASPAGNVEIDLDAVYPVVLPGSWVVLEHAAGARLYLIEAASTQARNDFLLAGKVTRLQLDSADGLAAFKADPRGTTVHLDPRPLPLGQARIGGDFGTAWIDVAGDQGGLEPGRPLLLSGFSGGRAAAEVARLAGTEALETGTRLHFRDRLAAGYARDTLAVYANIAAAAQGQATGEVLGHGDAARAFQSFTLKRAPLTYRARPGAPHGAASTLEIRVDGVLWTEVRSLHGHGPAEPVYTTAEGDDGGTVVRFGDGRTGRRLPTGRSNVTAVYRHGSGPGGNVPAGTVTTVLDRPLGLKAVHNPLPAGGGTAPQAPEQVRRNAPNTVRTFGRIVSLRDFEDAARDHPGIAKAHAELHWDGEVRTVRLTVAGDGGTRVVPGSGLHAALLADLDARRDPNRFLQLRGHRDLVLRLAASVLADAPTHRPEDVLAAVRAALAGHFSFANLQLGHAVRLSDLYPVLHAVPGVLAVDVDTFHAVDPGAATGTGTLQEAIPLSGDQLPVLEDPGLAAVTTTTTIPGGAP